jgi:hypothetical protein
MVVSRVVLSHVSLVKSVVDSVEATASCTAWRAKILMRRFRASSTQLWRARSIEPNVFFSRRILRRKSPLRLVFAKLAFVEW